MRRIADLATDLQALSHRLHSSKLESLGLAGAAAGFCEELSDQQSIEIDCHSENISETLPIEISLCLFRVLQEALLNAIKHSGSRRFEVLLRGEADAVELTIKDSGSGFEPQQGVKGRGLGLTSMKERLALVHGHLSIHSELGRGTTVHARVPLRLKRSPEDKPR
ncbi:MAG TPA: ATP-binding protein [Vicinamibacterales bacterium]|nr:ATP-binding protein [Vicinamibacterales bacterium]